MSKLLADFFLTVPPDFLPILFISRLRDVSRCAECAANGAPFLYQGERDSRQDPSPPCHGQPVFKEYISDDTFEVADDILSRHVSLPMYTELNDKDIYLITDIVKEVIDDCKK